MENIKTKTQELIVFRVESEKLHEILTKNLSLIVSNITKHKVISSHSDISTKTGEMLEIFILDTYYETEFNANLDR